MAEYQERWLRLLETLGVGASDDDRKAFIATLPKEGRKLLNFNTIFDYVSTTLNADPLDKNYLEVQRAGMTPMRTVYYVTSNLYLVTELLNLKVRVTEPNKFVPPLGTTATNKAFIKAEFGVGHIKQSVEAIDGKHVRLWILTDKGRLFIQEFLSALGADED